MNEQIKVILVDDNEDFRKALRLFLSKSDNLEIIAEASNGREFLEIIKKNTVDIVLMDIQMPIMNGIDATKKALLINPNLKIIVLSTYEEDQYIKSLAKEGVSRFLLKDSVFDSLISTIKKIYNER